MKKLRHLARASLIHFMIFSLLSSWTPVAQAQTNNNAAVGSVLQLANIAMGTYGQYLGQRAQLIQMQIQTQRNQQMMLSLSPSCKKPDGTPCFAAQGKLFPECPLPASMANLPQNVCMGAAPDPNQISSMISYEAIAASWMNHYDQMLNEASNMPAPVGAKCLQDKQKALNSQLIEMVNNLTRLQDQLNKDKETFRNNNKKILEDLGTLNDELFGASSGNNLNIKTMNFSKYFSASCQSILSNDLAEGAQARGFNGLLQSLVPKNRSAAEYMSNREIIQADIRRDIEKKQALIKESGLDDWMKTNTEVSKVKSVEEAVQKQVQQFTIARERIKKELSALGYDIPTMDKNFSVDFGEFVASADTFFKKKYINECTTGADKSGIALSTSQILNSLQQKSTKNTGTAVAMYRTALQNILNSDSFIQDKLNQIKALESTYQDISITYQSSGAQLVTETPYDLYMRTIAKCEERFQQSDVFSSSAQGASQKVKVERGKKLLTELKGMHDNFASDLGHKVLDRLLNCDGEAKKAGGDCTPSLDYHADNFCISNANQCANEIQGCYAQANTHVESRKAKMNTLAKIFNANASAMIAHSNQLYTQQKNAVMEMVKVVQARFPGSNFKIPEDMFVALPELKKDKYGVELANDGNLAFMDELPKKLDKLKSVFEQQRTEANKIIDDYISKQKMAMKEQKSRWEKLHRECKSAIDQSTQALNEQNQKMAQNQAELDGQVAQYCQKYYALRDNPMPCDDVEELAETAGKIQSRLTNETNYITMKFKNACNAYNNEKITENIESCASGDSDCKKRNDLVAQKIARNTPTHSANKKAKGASLSSLCRDGAETSDDKFIQAVAKKLPESEEEILSNISNFERLNAKIDDIEDQGFFEEIQGIANSSGLSGAICKKLYAINTNASSSSSTEMEGLKIEVEQTKKDIAQIESSGTVDAAALAAKNKTLRDKQEKIIELQSKTSLNKKAEIAQALTKLDPVELTSYEKHQETFQRIGQQIFQGCDTQAYNINLNKNMGGSAQFLQNFDRAVLGR